MIVRVLRTNSIQMEWHGTIRYPIRFSNELQLCTDRIGLVASYNLIVLYPYIPGLYFANFCMSVFRLLWFLYGLCDRRGYHYEAYRMLCRKRATIALLSTTAFIVCF